MSIARVAIFDLLGMLWSALVGISSVLDVCPSPDEGGTWKSWWSRKTALGKACASFVWLLAIGITVGVAYTALYSTAEYFWVR